MLTQRHYQFHYLTAISRLLQRKFYLKKKLIKFRIHLKKCLFLLPWSEFTLELYRSNYFNHHIYTVRFIFYEEKSLLRIVNHNKLQSHLPLVTTPLISVNKLEMAEWNDFKPSGVVKSCWYFEPHSRNKRTMLLTYKIRLACNCDGNWKCSVSGVITDEAVCNKLNNGHIQVIVALEKAGYEIWVMLP